MPLVKPGLSPQPKQSVPLVALSAAGLWPVTSPAHMFLLELPSVHTREVLGEQNSVRSRQTARSRGISLMSAAAESTLITRVTERDGAAFCVSIQAGRRVDRTGLTIVILHTAPTCRLLLSVSPRPGHFSSPRHFVRLLFKGTVKAK